jgi:hypothetical protein
MKLHSQAIAEGFTCHVCIEIGDSVFEALIRPDTDRDSAFKCFDTDNNEWIGVNGWLASDIADIT